MRIDAHQHFWDPARGDYGWLTPAEGGLYRPFQPDALATQIYACGVNGTVLVQAAPTEAETDYLLAVARTTPWVLGVIGWIDFDAADVRAQIAARSEDMLFVGVRPMLQDMADRRWIVEDRHILSFAALANARITFDALIRADQIDAIAELAEYHPNLSIVVDHAGKPAITANGPDRHWIDGIARLAARGNVACKLSGLLSEAPRGADAGMLRPYVDVQHAAFGARRLLWGSDWPILTNVGDYTEWHATASSLIPPTDHDAVFGQNARRLYHLESRS
jgi:L-fuconolactonase